MSRHYGVKCRECGTPIILGDLDEFDPNQLPIYTVPLDRPIPCKECGYSGMYEHRETIQFEIPEDPM